MQIILKKLISQNLIYTKGIFMFFSTCFDQFCNWSPTLAGHFGFNTNILETNVLNLAVVLAIVIIYVGDALRGLLENRKQTILNNFREAEQRTAEARERLAQATLYFDQVQAKAQQIFKQASITIDLEEKQLAQLAQEDIARLGILQQETINFAQQKVQTEIAQKLVSLAFERVRNKLTQRLAPAIQTAINNFQIVLFTSYKPN
jgi:F-type H+-transporting ATPase subunit b